MTWIITMALMVPTTIYVHLRLPRLRALLESITILPIVIPPIVLTVGVLQVFPVQLQGDHVAARPRVRHPGDAVRLPGDRRRACARST